MHHRIPRIGTYTAPQHQPRRDLWSAVWVTTAIHLGVMGLLGSAHSRSTPSSEVPIAMDLELIPIEIEPVEPDTKSPLPLPAELHAETKPSVEKPEASTRRPVTRVRSEKAPEGPVDDSPSEGATEVPSEAGEAMVADSRAVSPPVLDLTSGHAGRYGGGVTVSRGGLATVSGRGHPTGQHRTSDSQPRASTPRSKARPVALRGRPDCDRDWPKSAKGLSIHHQIVRVKVLVDIDNSILRAWVVDDPGYGFGDAALACVKRKRFVAARDEQGRPTRAASPLIEVQFERL